MKSIGSKIGTVLVIGIFLFFGLKGCIKTSYGVGELKVYQQVSETGESNTAYFAPSNYLIFKKQYSDQYEYAVFLVRGENATHYFGPVYNSGESLLGLRIYSDATDVWKVEMELVDKDGNLTESTFNDIGESFRDIIIFRDNSVELGDYIYERIETTQADKDFVVSVTKYLK